MQFGLSNAPATFQYYINNLLYDLLDKTCTTYLDDILVYFESKKEYRTHVREDVKRLMDAGLQININKCEFETLACHGTSFPLTEGLGTSPHLPRYLSDRSHDLWAVYIARPLWPSLVFFPLYATTVLSPKPHSSPRDIWSNGGMRVFQKHSVAPSLSASRSPILMLIGIGRWSRKRIRMEACQQVDF
jgi:hypothetical protein